MRRLRQCRNLVGSRCRRLQQRAALALVAQYPHRLGEHGKARPARWPAARLFSRRRDPARSPPRVAAFVPPLPPRHRTPRRTASSAPARQPPGPRTRPRRASCCRSRARQSANPKASHRRMVSARVSVRGAEQMTRVAYASLSRAGGCGRRAATTSNRARAPRWPRFRPGLPAPRPELTHCAAKAAPRRRPSRHARSSRWQTTRPHSAVRRRPLSGDDRSVRPPRHPPLPAPAHPDVPGRLLALSTLNNAVAAHFFSTLAPLHDLRPRLAEITVPTLVLVGAHDWVCAPAASRAIAQGLPDARLVELPDAGHFGFSETPEPFLHSVRAHLTRTRITRTHSHESSWHR